MTVRLTSDDVFNLMKYGIYEFLLCSQHHATVGARKRLMKNTQSLSLKSENLGKEIYQLHKYNQ